jgi:hypothetical protein
MRGIIGVGVGTKRACGNDAVVLSMGLVWTEVCILAQRATNLRKGFSYLNYHTRVDCLLHVL